MWRRGLWWLLNSHRLLLHVGSAAGTVGSWWGFCGSPRSSSVRRRWGSIALRFYWRRACLSSFGNSWGGCGMGSMKRAAGGELWCVLGSLLGRLESTREKFVAHINGCNLEIQGVCVIKLVFVQGLSIMIIVYELYTKQKDKINWN